MLLNVFIHLAAMNPNQMFEETKPTAKSIQMSSYFGKKQNFRAKEIITIPSDDEQVIFDIYET